MLVDEAGLNLGGASLCGIGSQFISERKNVMTNLPGPGDRDSVVASSSSLQKDLCLGQVSLFAS